CATPPTAVSTLSLHDALPISAAREHIPRETAVADAYVDPAFIDRRLALDLARLEPWGAGNPPPLLASRLEVMEARTVGDGDAHRSEEHTSELQSRENLVCRLL